MGVPEKIRELEDEIRKTQKNKATEFHIGLLKAKIARMRRGLLAAVSAGGGGGGTFASKKSGDATVAIIGFPSVGKSTFLNRITNAESKTASYAFTTLTCIPGMLTHKGAKIQILDLPGIIEGAKDGKGRGKEVIGVARSADLILVMIDAQHPEHFGILERELHGMGIRLGQKPPDVHIKKTIRGGLAINTTLTLTKIDNRMITAIMGEYGMHSADMNIRDDIDVEQLIDVMEGNRVYLSYVVIANKMDLADAKEVRKLLGRDFVPISAEKGINLELAKEAIYNALRFINVYTKPRGGEADMSEPLIMRRGCTVHDVCSRLHRDLNRDFRYALIWGKSVKHPGQRVGPTHVMMDGDVITIFKK
jgi:uncharacterized protein